MINQMYADKNRYDIQIVFGYSKFYTHRIVNFSIEVYRKVFVLLEELWVPLCRIFIAAFVSASINNPQEQL